jgi:Rps23 Pro-64 3,4-dihydroxylase Tpa1-like proline 4-hydroxylase
MLGPLPPHDRIADFLPPEQHEALLDWVLRNEKRFRPATINKGRTDSGNEVDPEQRVALTSRDIGPLEPLLRESLLAALARLISRTGTVGPQPRSLELELAAQRDGAHFRAHLDIPVGQNRAPLAGDAGDDRILSAVYYFHRQPKGFSGGELRLFRFGAAAEGSGEDPANHVDIAPDDNSLVAFSSWVCHEVRRVNCPSKEFRDYRFALNCWYCRPLAAGRSRSEAEPRSGT